MTETVSRQDRPVRKFFAAAQASLLSGVLILCASIISLPVIPGIEAVRFRICLVGATVILLFLPLLIRRITTEKSLRYLIPIIRWAGFLLPAAAIIVSCVWSLGLPHSAAIAILILMLVGYCLFRAHEPLIPENGIISLLFTIGLVVSLEMTLDTLPAHWVLPEIATTPPLVNWIDKGDLVYTKNGFRGRRPCLDCSDHPLRIFTMGGSSTYGMPMYYTVTTYSAVLERLLQERRPLERFEIFNAGIPGFGVFQILDTLDRIVLPYKPDIVTVDSWFNDHGQDRGWFGMPGQSDYNSYMQMRFLRWLQDWKPYRFIHRTRTYAWARLILVNAKEAVRPLFGAAKAPPKEDRSTPEEFREGLKRVVALGHKHDFLPVFVMEPENRPRNLTESIEANAYQRAMVEVAREENVPLVDTLTALQSHEGNWLFYDIIHPNEAAHRVIAETIYDDLFLTGGQTDWGRSFFKSRGIKVEVPNAVRSPNLQLEHNQAAAKDLCIELRAPYASASRVSASLLQDEDEIAQLNPIGEGFSTFKFRLPADRSYPPLIDFTIAARSHAFESGTDKLSDNGAKGVAAEIPFHLELASGVSKREQGSFIKFREVRLDPKVDGYNVIVFDAKLGTIQAIDGFSTSQGKNGAKVEAERLYKFLENASNASKDGRAVFVALVMSGENASDIDPQRLGKILRTLGGSFAVPANKEAFIFIGRSGAPQGSAVEKIGGAYQHLEIGNSNWSAAELLEVRSFGPCAA